jgi:regulatory protein
MSVITALEVQKRNKQRVSVYLDGEYAFSLTLIEAAKLHKGQQLSEPEVAALRDEDTVLQAVDSAARFLGFRPRSLQEVRRNLTEKEFPPPIVEAAMQRLTTMGHLDDRAFARYWVQSRSAFKPLSQRALRQELRQKGIEDAIITEILSELEESELAYRAAQTQLRRLRRSSRRDFKVKIASFLQRRGFSFSTARDVVDRLIEEVEGSDADYFNVDSGEINEE